jgi:hypothetical protein
MTWLTWLPMYAGSRPGVPFVPARAALKIWVVVPDDASAKREIATLSGVSQFRAGQSVDDSHSLAAAFSTGLNRHLLGIPTHPLSMSGATGMGSRHICHIFGAPFESCFVPMTSNPCRR